MAKPSNLVIVESPSKAKTIGKYLGNDYVVKASMGHLRDLPKSTMGVDLEHDFAPEYIPVPGKEKLIDELRAAAQNAETVYLATDPDREGEAIAWHLTELLELPQEKTHRVTFNAITQKTVTASIRELLFFVFNIFYSLFPNTELASSDQSFPFSLRSLPR